MVQFIKNKKYGYVEVQPKPTDSELKDYYEKKYYEAGLGQYSKNYTEEEFIYIQNKIIQKDFVIAQLLDKKSKRSLLDIGCGEGFALNYYQNKGWDVKGIDHSSRGIKEHHPQLLAHFIQGNIFEVIQEQVQQGIRYDLVWLDNVLEHVTDPETMVRQCQRLTKENGVLVIEVPNDYSDFQAELIEQGKVSKKYWDAYPDHLNYFSRQSLEKLCEAEGWSTYKTLADFPIEWFLSNEYANYVENKETGKAAHASRIFLENFLSKSKDEDMQGLIDLYEALSKIGQGRNITGIFVRNNPLRLPIFARQ